MGRVSRHFMDFLMLYVIALILVLSVKMTYAYTVPCEPPKSSFVIKYRIDVLTTPAPNETREGMSLSGKALLIINDDSVVVHDLDSGAVIMEFRRSGDGYEVVMRSGGSMYVGVSPFFLPKPCTNPIYKGIFKLKYFNIHLDYDFGILHVYWRGSFLKLGLDISVWYPGDSDFEKEFFSVIYVAGVGVSGSFAVPREAVLLDGAPEYPLLGFSYVMSPEDNETMPRGVRDLAPISLPGVAAGVALILQGALKLWRMRRRGGR